MEGLFMFWLSWVAWIIVTFLLPKSQKRILIAGFILLFIIMFAIEIPLAKGTINLGFIWLAFGCYWMFHRQARKKLFLSFMFGWFIAAVYAGFSLWTMFDPIIMIVQKEWMMASILFLLSILLMKDSLLRMTVVTLGMIHGEVLSHLVTSTIWGLFEIGNGLFFDGLALSLVILCIHILLKQILGFLQDATEKWRSTTESL
ncbi:hypothetical protein ACI2JA_01960 [Alkalihalobacillus sp. NPDC078783]